jgi:CBS domain containing-hemolysin-like protein
MLGVSIGARSILYIIILVLLLFLSAMFSASEMAFSTLNIFRVRQNMKGNKVDSKQARRVYQLMKQFPKVLTTVLIANNLVNLGASSFLTYIFTTSLNLGGYGVLVATLMVSTLVIVFGEILPKNIAKSYPEKVAYLFVYPLSWVITLLTPISWIFYKVNSRLIRRINVDDDERVTATENELLDIVDTIEKEGVLEKEESEIIKSAIRFDEKTVNDAMVKKESVVAFYTDSKLDDIIRTVEHNKYSRYPVIMRDTGKVIGIIRQRSLFSYLIKHRNDLTPFDISEIISPPRYVSYRRILPYALEKMQRDKNHILIVVNNVKEKDYLGILTMEDVLEEIVGEIYDEYDRLPVGVVEIGHNIFEVKGDVKVEDFFDEFLDETNFPNTKFTTRGEWAKRLFRSKIKVGTKKQYDNIEITITDSTKDTILSMEIEEQTKCDDDDE